MKTGIILLNFGEPENATPEEVVPFLERIFLQNRTLGSGEGEEAARKRARELAERRAPGLIQEYEEIGGSPLTAQCYEQARLLEDELQDRGHEVQCYVGMQFTAPFIRTAVAQARDDGVEQLIGLPVYPLCGKSTNMAALDLMNEAAEELEWDVDVREITGWHRHPDYARFHGEHVREFLRDQDVSLHARGTRLVFSAHGTPVSYLEDGPRYVRYVEEFCRLLARELGVGDYDLGYQNHDNRPGVEWTSPDIEEVVGTVNAEGIVVVAVSFMHEQSETLAELDDELREVAEERGIAFHRVPIPHDSDRFIRALADLTEPLLTQVPAFDDLQLKRCLCRKTPYTFCLNAGS